MRYSDNELVSALRGVLGLPEASFRRAPDQLAIVRDILGGRDVLAVMPTGGGKSVCYQVPAMCLPGVTVVVSPLVALIQDQGQFLHKNGVPVACLAGGFLLDREGPHTYPGEDSAGYRSRRDRIFMEAAAGGYRIIYVTPERLRTGAFIRFAQNARISLVAVDEAHCVSLWGYEFRPRYLEISRFIRRLDSRPAVAAFTATATAQVREDIRRFLGLRSPREYICPAAREDLRFSVRRFRSAAGKLDFVESFVRERRGQSGMIYCSAAASVDRVYAALKSSGVQILRYYARLDSGGEQVPLGPGESKKSNLDAFRRSPGAVMVTTTALGMGIDKGDLRYVLHYELPMSPEDYFQEAGRAGRDGLGGECVLCCAPEDVRICRSLIDSTISAAPLAPQAKAIRRRAAEDKLRAMLDYCRLDDSRALAGFLRDYFEAPADTDPQADELRRAMLEHIRRVDAVYANRTKVAGELRRGLMSGQGLTVGRPGRDGRAPRVSYSLEGPALTYFDMMVADAVYTLIKYRVKTVTARGVMGLLSGDPSLTLRPERREAVEESLRKMMSCRITIDRRESTGYGLVYANQGDRSVITGPFLPLFGKNTGFGYDPAVLPPLYEYAEILNGQFYTLPTEQLHVPDLPASGVDLALTWYLLLRVGSMGRGRTSRVIRRDTMLKTLDLPLPEGAYERVRRLRTIVDKERLVLSHLVSLGRIRGFTVEADTGDATVEI